MDKCESKLHWDNSSFPWEWLLIKEIKNKITSADELAGENGIHY